MILPALCLFLAALLLPAQESQVPEAQVYEKLITKDAVTSKGVFIVHKLPDHYYYEIPLSQLDKEFLWNTRIARTTLGVGFGGALVADRVVRWHLRDRKIQLLDVNYDVTADPRSPIAAAVHALNNDTIVMSFDIAATGKDGAPVIEVTRLFNSEVSEFSVKQRLGATFLDSDRTYIDRVSTYPENIEVEATQTWTRNDAASPAPGQMHSGNATLVLHHSMVRLPDNPMPTREYDDRVGYFFVERADYSRDLPRARYICRWRLDKPIVYYIDSATPLQWREAVRKGVEAWQPAFAAAGFPQAIVAKMAPENDPAFSPEDIRNSVIRWLPTTVQDAFGPNVHDPRTGEILNADIEFNQNILNVVRSWYLTQIGPLDPRAGKRPLPDELTALMIEYIVTHEVGHTLGLEHNLKASSMYPADKVHDRDWVHRMGFTPSIMDYARFDYVAQPEDGIALEDVVARVGPYDRWAIHWGYAPAAGKDELNRWAREQENTPWLRYVTPAAFGAEPGELREAVGDADAVQSTGLGLKNLKRVAKMLLPAATSQPGETFEDMERLYNAMLGQWTIEMNHVVAIVGGVDARTKHSGESGPVFTPVPAGRQKRAVAFLNENAFTTPLWAVDPLILRRVEPAGALNRVRNMQINVLNNLLGSARFTRLVEVEALDGATAWPVSSFLTAVRMGIWKELDAAHPRIDAYRRNLQRAWLDIANLRVNASVPSWTGPQVASGDEKPFYRTQLRALRAAIAAALPRTTDPETRSHLESVTQQIAAIQSLKSGQSVPVSTPSSLIGINGIAPPASFNCWGDF